MDPDSNPPSRRRRSGATGPPSRRRRFGETGSLSRLRREGSPGLDAMVTDGRGRPLRDGGLARWLRGVAPSSARGEVSVVIVSDRKMRVLNRTYRGKDYATDVLSFSSASESRAPSPEPRASFLGDIVIAEGVAARQAREHRHSYQTELRVLTLHGLLHLLGYDHDDRHDNGRMARAEARLRKKAGLPGGVIARAKADVSRRPSTSLAPALSTSPFDRAQGDPEALEGAKGRSGAAPKADLCRRSSGAAKAD